MPCMDDIIKLAPAELVTVSSKAVSTADAKRSAMLAGLDRLTCMLAASPSGCTVTAASAKRRQWSSTTMPFSTTSNVSMST